MGWLRNLRTQSKLLIAFALIALVGALVIGWNVYSFLRLQGTVHQLYQEVQSLALLEDIQHNALQQAYTAKSYVLTGNPYYLGRYREYGDLLRQSMRRAVVEADSIDEGNDLSILDSRQQDYDLAFAEVTAAYDTNPQEAMDLAEGGLDNEMSLVQDHLGGMIYKAQLGLQGRVQEVDDQVRTAVIVGAASLVLLAGLVIVSAIVTNQVAEPMLHLTNAVVAFESNAYDPALLESYLRRRDEMGQLARAFGGMTRSISESVQGKDHLLAAASRFVPSQYLDFLEKDSIIEVNLGDHVSAEMAVLFSDVRAFTTMSEGMSPQENFDFVNAYLQMVSPIIQKHSGFIVKFLGDGMMAVFPYGVDDAVRAGIEKQRRVETFNAELQKQGRPAIRVGIGIHTGHMMVGMIGEEKRMQGDAFSDNVNLTSRVEGLTKFYGVSMIITEETLLRLERPVPYAMRFLGKARVQGRERPISLYDVFEGDAEGVRQSKLATKEDLERGLKFYQAGKAAEARDCFAAVLERFPEDQVAALYLERTQTLLAQGVPPDWDGVETMAAK